MVEKISSSGALAPMSTEPRDGNPLAAWLPPWSADARAALLASAQLDPGARALIAALLDRLSEALAGASPAAPQEAVDDTCSFIYPH